MKRLSLVCLALLLFVAGSFAASKPEITKCDVHFSNNAITVNVHWQSENPVTKVRIFAGPELKEVAVDEADNRRNPQGYSGEASAVVPIANPGEFVGYVVMVEDELRLKSEQAVGKVPGVSPQLAMQPQLSVQQSVQVNAPAPGGTVIVPQPGAPAPPWPQPGLQQPAAQSVTPITTQPAPPSATPQIPEPPPPAQPISPQVEPLAQPAAPQPAPPPAAVQPAEDPQKTKDKPDRKGMHKDMKQKEVPVPHKQHDKGMHKPPLQGAPVIVEMSLIRQGPNTVSLKFKVADDKGLKQLTILVLDQKGVPVDKKTIPISGKSWEGVSPDFKLKAGSFTIVAQATDLEENNSPNKFQDVTIGRPAAPGQIMGPEKAVPRGGPKKD